MDNPVSNFIDGRSVEEGIYTKDGKLTPQYS
jgi:hypothetical protein